MRLVALLTLGFHAVAFAADKPSWDPDEQYADKTVRGWRLRINKVLQKDEHAKLREQTLELCHMKLRSSAQRLAAFLLRLAEDTDVRPARFVLPYEKRFLAAKIGCTQENLSRAFAALRPLGVESQRGAVVISDVEALRTFARLPPATPDVNGPG